MRNVMYAAVAFAAISIGVVAIGIGKAANAYGDRIEISGSLFISGVDVHVPSKLRITCPHGTNGTC